MKYFVPRQATWKKCPSWGAFLHTKRHTNKTCLFCWRCSGLGRWSQAFRWLLSSKFLVIQAKAARWSTPFIILPTPTPPYPYGPDFYLDPLAQDWTMICWKVWVSLKIGDYLLVWAIGGCSQFINNQITFRRQLPERSQALTWCFWFLRASQSRSVIQIETNTVKPNYPIYRAFKHVHQMK